MSAEKPTRLSLAVAGSSLTVEQLERFLAALEPAGLTEADETIIAATPGAATADLDARARAAGPTLQLQLHEDRATPMELWGRAMAATRGEHVAVLDVRDPPAPGWAAAWESGLAKPGHVVCGPVAPGDLPNSASWAAYLSEYGQFCPPLDPERLEEVPGNNVVLPRALLPPRERLESDGFWKTFHLAGLARERGELPLTVLPGLVVTQHRRHELGAFLLRRVLHGRCYGGRRHQQPGAPPRLLCAAFTPVLPALRLVRLIRRLRGKPIPAGRWTSSLLPLVLAEIAWSWGELQGYLLGAGTSCERLW